MLSPRILLTLSATSLVLGSLGYAAITQAASPTPEPSQIAQTPQSSPGQQQGPAGAQGAPRPRGPRHDFAAAAQRLGVTEQALRSALGVPDQPPRDGSRPNRPDLSAAAQQLGVTEAQLQEALRTHRSGDRGPRPMMTE